MVEVKESHGRSSAPSENVIRITGSTRVLDVTYMTKAKRLVTACADGYIAFWESDFECKRWHVVDYLYCDTMQTGLFYSDTADRLLSWTNQAGDNSMNVWDVRPGCDNFGEKVGMLKEHDGIVVTCLELNCHVGEVMVTGGTDGVLIVWDVTLTPHVQELPEVISRISSPAAHKRAINGIVYSAEHDLLLTSGYEYEAFGWDMTGEYMQCELAGHRDSLIGIELVQHETERAVTADVRGCFKLWDLRRAHGAFMPCLQSFSATSGLTTVRPTIFTAVWGQGCQLVMFSHKMHVLESAWAHESRTNPPACFVGVSEWSGHVLAVRQSYVALLHGETGQILDTFYDAVAPGVDITCAAADRAQRKLFLGLADGVISMHSTFNMSKLGETRITAKSEICGLFFVDEDQIIISVHWNGMICVYDGLYGALAESEPAAKLAEEQERAGHDDDTGAAPEKQVPEIRLLRSIDGAHSESINQVAFAYNLSLIATVASEDLSIRVWDYQYLGLESMLVGHNSEITAITFMAPQPALLSADSAGYLMLWPVRPHTNAFPGTPLCCVRNYSQWNSDVENSHGSPTRQTTAITAMSVIWCKTESSMQNSNPSCLVVAGDEDGCIKLYDWTEALPNLGFTSSLEEILDGSSAWNFRRNYDPRVVCHRPGPLDGVPAGRKLTRFSSILNRGRVNRSRSQSGLAEGLEFREEMDADPTPKGLKVRRFWRAHAEGITAIRTSVLRPSSSAPANHSKWLAEMPRVVDEKDTIIISISLDGTAHLWGIAGNLLGVISTQTGMATLPPDEPTWRLGYSQPLTNSYVKSTLIAVDRRIKELQEEEEKKRLLQIQQREMAKSQAAKKVFGKFKLKKK
jgi:WD40 repeat protein